MTSIGDYAFGSDFCNDCTSESECFFWGNECTELKSITIPKSVTFIADNAFCGRDIEHISVDENNQNYSSVDGVLFNKDKTVLISCPSGKSDNVSIPESVTSIDDNAFYGCENLTNITVYEGNKIYNAVDSILRNLHKKTTHHSENHPSGNT